MSITNYCECDNTHMTAKTICQFCFEAEFKEFCLDHLKHFDCVPCEFESSTGAVLLAGDCWNLATKMELYK